MKWIGLFVLMTWLAGCATPKPAKPQVAERATVVWVSIDGLRFDYLNRSEAPTLRKLWNEGRKGPEIVPVFPSLTFPNHISQATGVFPDRHGIVGNSFYDREQKRLFEFPASGDPLRAEPIWVTAKKQGVRVAVLDWPMSQGQSGELASDYFNLKFDARQTDDARLSKVAEIYEKDDGAPPLRLMMTYIGKVDSTGHKTGPASKETFAALEHADRILGTFIQRIAKKFDATKKPGDVLYVVITTDHGMENVYTLVNLKALLGADLARDVRIVTGGPVANLFLDDVPEAERAARKLAIREKLNVQGFCKAYEADSPFLKGKHFADRARVGDLVAVLSPHHTFNAEYKTPTEAVKSPSGMHGYDPEETMNMLGSSIIWRSDRHMVGGFLEANNAQWHATIAKLLGIQPAANTEPAIDLSEE